MPPDRVRGCGRPRWPCHLSAGGACVSRLDETPDNPSPPIRASSATPPEGENAGALGRWTNGMVPRSGRGAAENARPCRPRCLMSPAPITSAEQGPSWTRGGTTP